MQVDTTNLKGYHKVAVNFFEIQHRLLRKASEKFISLTTLPSTLDVQLYALSFLVPGASCNKSSNPFQVAFLSMKCSFWVFSACEVSVFSCEISLQFNIFENCGTENECLNLINIEVFLFEIEFREVRKSPKVIFRGKIYFLLFTLFTHFGIIYAFMVLTVLRRNSFLLPCWKQMFSCRNGFSCLQFSLIRYIFFVKHIRPKGVPFFSE